MADDPAFGLTCRALGFVLGVDPSRLRPDTPLAGIGADSVAIIAAVDVLEAGLSARGISGIDNERVRTAVTVGDIAASLPPLPAEVLR